MRQWVEITDNVSGAGDQRHGLAGVNAGLKIDLLIFRIGHKVADGYVWGDYTPGLAKRDPAGTF